MFSRLRKKLNDAFHLRFALIALGLVLLTAGMLIGGDQTYPQVRSFNHQHAAIGPRQVQLVIAFSRPMNRASVEENFQITPPVEGRFSWIGRRMAYTLDEPLPRETAYEVRISQSAIDQFGRPLKREFVANFQTLPARFAYLSDVGSGHQQLWLYELESGQTRPITPDPLRVTRFQPHPDGQRIFFMATREDALGESFYLSDQQALYVVDLKTEEITLLAGTEGLVNHDFSISRDGAVIGINRASLTASGQIFSRDIWWKVDGEKKWEQFWKPGLGVGDFHLAPDGITILVASPEGYLLLPLIDESGRDPQYVGQFWDTYGFSPTGRRILFEENSDFGLTVYYNHWVLLHESGERLVIGENLGNLAFPKLDDEEQHLYFSGLPIAWERAGRLQYQLYQHHLEEETRTVIGETSDFSIEAFDLLPDRALIVAEHHPVDSPDNRGPEVRKIEDDKIQPMVKADLMLLDLRDGEWKPLGIQGRKPQWLP